MNSMRSLLRNVLLLTTTALLAVAPVGQLAAADNPEVKVLMIGYPDQDSVDPVTGAPIPGIDNLKAAFAAAHPEINLNIISIPWGSGATAYGAKTEAMVQANEACLYEMPAAAGYGRRGSLVDLDTMIAADKDFQNVWGPQLELGRSWGPDNPKSLFYIPNNTGERVIHWDAKIFEDFGVEPLSEQPTLDEIAEKAAKLTGTDPVTGEQTYGYWYQGKYAVWQFMAISHALGANWGSVDDKGVMSINWDTPEYLAALKWFVDMAKYAPSGALGGDGMPQGFLTDQNVVAIIPEGEAGYFVQPMLAQPDLADRTRTSFNLKGPDGMGGLSSVSPITMAATCDQKEAAWTVLKWLAGDPEAQKYYFEASGRLPVIEGGEKAVPQVAALKDGKVILGQPLTAEALYPWAAEQPRWALQTALEGALAGTITPEDALKQAQAETDEWLKQQAASK
jgi:multiple sugar transport system substrate-binding protein